jgi:hypothetical protein
VSRRHGATGRGVASATTDNRLPLAHVVTTSASKGISDDRRSRRRQGGLTAAGAAPRLDFVRLPHVEEERLAVAAESG